MGFVEVTPGHGSSSPTITDTTGGNASTASTYVHLTWDPTDFAVDGTNATRTFGLTGPATADMQVDGYEVFGNVQAIFATIPEPSTALLTGMVILFGLAARRRR